MSVLQMVDICIESENTTKYRFQNDKLEQQFKHMVVAQFVDICIESENITKYSSLRRGDQLAVEGEIAGIGYYHHGLFLGHEQGIADFGGNDKFDAKIRRVDLLEFTGYGKRRLVRILYTNGQCLPNEVAAQNAEKLLKNPNHWGPFNALSNNCEHFASKCKTGIAVSRQVINKLRECIQNPLQLMRYAVASSVVASSSLFGSLRN